MIQNSSNVKISGGSFINNSSTFKLVNEQNGLTGALYESMVNRYVLTSIMQRSPDIASMGLGWRRPRRCPSCTRMPPGYPQDYYW